MPKMKTKRSQLGFLFLALYSLLLLAPCSRAQPTLQFRTNNLPSIQLRNYQLDPNDCEVRDGFLSLPANHQVDILVFDHEVANVGDTPFSITNPPLAHLACKGVDLAENLWRFTIRDQSGNLIRETYQPGWIPDLKPGATYDEPALLFDGGQYVNITGLRLGCYSLLVEVDPLNQWSYGNAPVEIRFEKRNGNIRLTNFPDIVTTIQPAEVAVSLQSLQTDVETLKKSVTALQQQLGTNSQARLENAEKNIRLFRSSTAEEQSALTSPAPLAAAGVKQKLSSPRLTTTKVYTPTGPVTTPMTIYPAGTKK